MRDLDREIGRVVVRVACVVVGLIALLAVAVALSFLYAARPDLVLIALYVAAAFAFMGWSVRRLRRQ